MTYCRRFVVLLFSIATFSQLSPTIAINQECVDKSIGLPPAGGADLDAFTTIILSRCDLVSDCAVDLESWSTNGDPNFASTCGSAGGEVYEIDGVLTCDSIDFDGATKFILNNIKACYAKVCTPSDAKANWESALSSSDSSCVYQGTVTSGTMMVGFSTTTTLFAAVSAALFVLVGIF
jgi:hypothetical protein